MQTGSGDAEAAVHDRPVRIAAVAVEPPLESHPPGSAAGVLNRGLPVHARPEQMEVVDRGEIADPDRVRARLELLQVVLFEREVQRPLQRRMRSTSSTTGRWVNGVSYARPSRS